MSRFISIKKETTYGTYVGTHTTFIDADSEKFAGQNDIQVPAGISRARRRFSPGKFTSDTGGFGIPVDARTLGLFLYGALGGSSVDTDEPVTGANEHVFYPEDLIPSYSVDIGLDNLIQRKVAGAVVGKNTITVEAERIAMMELDMPWSAPDPFVTTVDDPSYWGLSASLTDDILMAFHEVTARFGSIGQDYAAGSAKYPTRVELTIDNSVNPVNVVGQRGVYLNQVQKRIVEGSLNIIFEDPPSGGNAEDEYKKFLGNDSATSPQDKLTPMSLSLDIESAEVITGSTYHQCIIYLPRCVYKEGEPSLNGAGVLEQTLTFDAYESISAPTDPWAGTHSGLPDNYEIAAVLINDVSSDYDTY